MYRWFLIAKAALSVALAYYLPAFIPLIVAYWVGVAFISWRGKRGLPVAGEQRAAVEYLGGYPNLAPPQHIWLAAGGEGLKSGGMSVPYGAIRKVRVLKRAEGEAAARALGAVVVAASDDDLYLAVLWRAASGEEEILFRLPGGKGERELARLMERVEQLRREDAQRRRGAKAS
jgi:hypothetical protein